MQIDRVVTTFVLGKIHTGMFQYYFGMCMQIKEHLCTGCTDNCLKQTKLLSQVRLCLGQNWKSIAKAISGACNNITLIKNKKNKNLSHLSNQAMSL